MSKKKSDTTPQPADNQAIEEFVQSQKDEFVDFIQSALDDPEVPNIYANGFVQGMSRSDAYLILHRNGNPVAVINLSFTLAKTLSIQLGEMITAFEEATGQNIMTTDFVAQATPKMEAMLDV